MGRETKVGLLAGLTFIVCFAVILANRGRDSTVDASLPQVGFIHQPLPGPVSPPGGPRRSTQQTREHKGVGPQVAGAAAPDRTERISRRAAGRPAEAQSPTTPSPGRRETAEFTLPVPPQPGETGAAGPVVLVSTDEPTTEELRVQQSRQLQERLDALAAQVGGAGTTVPGAASAQGSRDQITNRTTNRSTPPPSRAADRSTRESQRQDAAPMRYKVQPGDSLSKVAARFYGRATNRGINAIYDANRSNLASPDAVRVGDELVIPALDGVLPAEANGVAAPATTRRSPVPSPPAEPAASPTGSEGPGSFRWYQIRRNDRYVTIAREQLGDERRWRELFELNKDRFPDPQRIKEGVRIRIPKSGDRAGNGR